MQEYHMKYLISHQFIISLVSVLDFQFPIYQFILKASLDQGWTHRAQMQASSSNRANYHL